MPDVSVRCQPELPVVRDRLLDVVQKSVAEHMSCWVPSKDESGYEYYDMDPRNEIDVELGLINGRSAKKALIVVEAYPYEDRMSNLKERLANIANDLAELYDLDSDDVSITFRPVGFDCWTTGAGR